MHADSDRLLATVEQVLKAGELGQRQRQQNRVPIDLAPLVADCIAVTLERHHLAADTIMLAPVPGAVRLRVLGIAEDLRTAILNLLDNAVKYSPPGLTALDIRCTLSISNYTFVALTITDNGLGIPESRAQAHLQTLLPHPRPLRRQDQGHRPRPLPRPHHRQATRRQHHRRQRRRPPGQHLHPHPPACPVTGKLETRWKWSRKNSSLFKRSKTKSIVTGRAFRRLKHCRRTPDERRGIPCPWPCRRWTSNLKQLLSAFNANHVKYVVIGGYAVFVHAQPRMTKDMDVFIESTPANAVATFKALAEFGAPLAQFTVDDFSDGRTVARFGVPPICFEVIQRIDGVDFASVYANSVEVMIDGELPARYIAGRPDHQQTGLRAPAGSRRRGRHPQPPKSHRQSLTLRQVPCAPFIALFAMSGFANANPLHSHPCASYSFCWLSPRQPQPSGPSRPPTPPPTSAASTPSRRRSPGPPAPNGTVLRTRRRRPALAALHHPARRRTPRLPRHPGLRRQDRHRHVLAAKATSPASTKPPTPANLDPPLHQPRQGRLLGRDQIHRQDQWVPARRSGKGTLRSAADGERR